MKSTNTKTLYKEGNPQKAIAEEAGCLQSHIQTYLWKVQLKDKLWL